jgi:hypothetical protein
VIRLLPLFALALAGTADTLVIGDFSHGDLDGWSAKAFAGRTRYVLVPDAGRHVLKADSRAAASGLYKEIAIDLSKTPYLHWSWKVSNTLGRLDEHTKRGDDYPARVYVVFSGGLFFWRTRAINYVWSNDQPPGTIWENAFTGNARMIAVRSGDAQAGHWFSERRDVRKDYQHLFGEDALRADAVAVMTDTDNSGTAAVAYYGDIYFSSE